MKLPHFGDCTHDGQPFSHGQVMSASSVACKVALAGLERHGGDPGAARVAVVDEPPGAVQVGMEWGAEPAFENRLSWWGVTAARV